jgi:hypothetical protein
LVVAQSSSEIPEGLMNNPVYRLQHMNVKKTLSFNEILNGELGHSSFDLLHLQYRTNYVSFYHLHIFITAYSALIVT